MPTKALAPGRVSSRRPSELLYRDPTEIPRDDIKFLRASRERTHLALHRIGKTDHVPRADSGGGGTRAGLGEGAGGGEAGYGKHGSYCIDLVALC